MAVVLALLSAFSWGTGDFFAGRLSRRERVIVVLAWTQLVGLLATLGLALGTGEHWPGLAALWPALVAGAAGPLGLLCFYRALSIGTMSIVAPISATGVAIPVLAGLVGGDRPGAAAMAGMLLATTGIVLASREEHEDDDAARAARLSIVLALGAALGFGTFLWVIAPASDASVPWSLVLARSVSVTASWMALLVIRGAGRRHPVAADAGAIVAVGILDIGANGLYALASTKGLLSIVGVLGSLYPVTTVVLARIVLGERLVRVQQLGVVLAFAGVVLLSA